jgi:hypothetical protein
LLGELRDHVPAMPAECREARAIGGFFGVMGAHNVTVSEHHPAIGMERLQPGRPWAFLIDRAAQSLGTVRGATRDRKRDVDEVAAAGRLRGRRAELRRWLPPG